MLSVDCISVHPNNLCVYQCLLNDDGTSRHIGRSDLRKDLKINRNKLSIQSSKKMSKAITYMAHTAENKSVKILKSKALLSCSV